MRLIDADAFKKQLENAYEYTELAEVIEMLDNAPTVNTDEIYKKGYHNGFFATHDVPPTVEPIYISDMPDDKVKDLQELAIDYGEGIAVFERKRPQGEQIAWEQGYEFGKNEKRPQGEWVIQRLQNGFDDVYCPFCNARPTRSEYGYYLRDNFCHECGADMRGE